MVLLLFFYMQGKHNTVWNLSGRHRLICWHLVHLIAVWVGVRANLRCRWLLIQFFAVFFKSKKFLSLWKIFFFIGVFLEEISQNNVNVNRLSTVSLLLTKV